MAAIYSNTYLTIAATKSEDDADGFHVEENEYRPSIVVYTDAHSGSHNIGENPLGTGRQPWWRFRITTEHQWRAISPTVIVRQLTFWEFLAPSLARMHSENCL
jgi:hypothetical protein